MISLIKQEDEFGCAIACAAMVLNVSYAFVLRDFENDFAVKGLSLKKLERYISDHGYATIKKSVGFFTAVGFADEELWKPFAPIHVVQTSPSFDSPDDHVIVMDAVGNLYCPSGVSSQKARESYAIRAVIGFYK